MHSHGNYYAYVDVAWGGWPSSDGWFVNNTVVLGGASQSYFGTGYLSDSGLIGHPELGLISGNTVHAKDAAVTVPCLNPSTGKCSSACPLEQWVAAGHDKGTTVRAMPNDEDVVAAARVLLGM